MAQGKTPKRMAEVYQDQAGRWRWRLVSAGRIIAESGQGYTRSDDAVKAFLRLKLGVPFWIRVWLSVDTWIEDFRR
jgi:uncharacterized protein YegP (UPF0339 family)